MKQLFLTSAFLCAHCSKDFRIGPLNDASPLSDCCPDLASRNFTCSWRHRNDYGARVSYRRGHDRNQRRAHPSTRDRCAGELAEMRRWGRRHLSLRQGSRLRARQISCRFSPYPLPGRRARSIQALCQRLLPRRRSRGQSLARRERQCGGLGKIQQGRLRGCSGVRPVSRRRRLAWAIPVALPGSRGTSEARACLLKRASSSRSRSQNGTGPAPKN